MYSWQGKSTMDSANHPVIFLFVSLFSLSRGCCCLGFKAEIWYSNLIRKCSICKVRKFSLQLFTKYGFIFICHFLSHTNIFVKYSFLLIQLTDVINIRIQSLKFFDEFLQEFSQFQFFKLLE